MSFKAAPKNRAKSSVSFIVQFEDLLLLSEGEMIYFGPASQAVAYFDSKGLTCPQHFNPGEKSYLEILTHATGCQQYFVVLCSIS